MPMEVERMAFNRAVQPAMEIILADKADAVLNFRADPALQNRIDELADKATDGELSDDERDEYRGYVRANNFLATLRAQARRVRTP